MEDFVRQSYLYDFYGELLTAHQQEIYEAVMFEDMSLGEAAGLHGISRQGVHDLIRRCGNSLEEYESKLHLVERFLELKKKAALLEEKLKEEHPDLPCVRALAHEISEDL